jgi:hypothetical protein
VETPRKFITAKLSIRKPGTVLIICRVNQICMCLIILLALMKIRAYVSKALHFAVINVRGVSTNKKYYYNIYLPKYRGNSI